MFNTGKHLPRRTFLRGMGAAVALPLLDSMVPAGRLWGKMAKQMDQPRLIAIELVHGAAGSNDWGATQNLWSPADLGRDFDLSPSALAPLEPFRDYLTIVSNTDVRMAEAYAGAETGADHARSSATFLTQAHPRRTEGSDVYVGTSMDQIHAQRFGQDTPLPSLQLCIENVDSAGGCSFGYSCIYTDAISWASATQPLPMIRDPRAVFEQLFGAGGTLQERVARRRITGSILDWIRGQTEDLKRTLPAGDRQRMDEYLTNIREIERRVQRVEAQNSSGEVREIPEAPVGVPDSFEEHMEIMFDLQVLALESDLTRVISFKPGRDTSSRVYPESGIEGGFHPVSHHSTRPDRVLQFYELNKYHVTQLLYLLDKLRNTAEGDTNLLDKTTIIFGSPMADGNIHNHRRCPLILLCHGNGQLEGNLHLQAPDGTPMANVLLSLLHGLGHDDLSSFGDSTGAFPLGSPT